MSIEKWKEDSMLLTKVLSSAFSGVGGRGWNKCRGARKRPWTASQVGAGAGLSSAVEEGGKGPGN